jgi:hypothetical protein
MASGLHPPGYTETGLHEHRVGIEAHSSGVSWGAVIAGAFAAAALYLILLALGAGFELSAASPWSNAGASARTLGAGAIVWLVFIEVVASSMGGYLTGRLRTKWVSAAGVMAGHAARVQAADSRAAAASPDSYYVSTLFHGGHAPSEAADVSMRAEAGAIFAHDMALAQMPPPDQTDLGQLVAARTGIPEADAEKRVSDTFAQALQDEDTARKATARFLLWMFLSLLIGALSASFAATIGGRQRDHLKVV